MTDRKTVALGVGGVGVAILLAALVVIGPGDFFLAEESTTVNETAAQSENATVLKTGTFSGDGGHEVTGTVSLIRDGGDLYLKFENYEQTQGPDVFVYVTPAADPDEKSEISAGRKVLIDGGEDGGESTKEGTFLQKLPDGVSADEINGVGIWCDQFSVSFGTATLEPVDESG